MFLQIAYNCASGKSAMKQKLLIVLVIFSMLSPTATVGATDLDGGVVEDVATEAEFTGVEIETPEPDISSDLTLDAGAVVESLDSTNLEDLQNNEQESTKESLPLPSSRQSDQQEPVVVGLKKSPPPSTEGTVLISKVGFGDPSYEFVEIYNPSDKKINLRGWQIQFLTKDFDKNKDLDKPTKILRSFKEDFWIGADETLVFAHQEMIGAWLLKGVSAKKFDDSITTDAIDDNGSIRLVDLASESPAVVDLVGWAGAKNYENNPAKDGGENKSLQRCIDGGIVKDSNDNLADFLSGRYYIIGSFFDCKIEEDNPTGPQEIELNEIGVNLDNKFVEIINSSRDLTVDVSGFEIKWRRDKSLDFKLAYKINDLEIEPGVVESFIPAINIFKKTAGEFVLFNGSGEMLDSYSYLPTDSGTSFAKFNGKWHVNYQPTPGEKNIITCKKDYLFSEENNACEKVSISPTIDKICAEGYEIGYTGTCVKICGAGYFRNPVTNRCNKIQDNSKKTKTCPKGYWLNPATNRCNKIKTKVAKTCPAGYWLNPATNRCNKIKVPTALKPCKEGYYRDPVTNRCRKIKTTTGPKPCKEGYERNPETGRCRKIVKNTGADTEFKPEDVVVKEGETLGWWMLGVAGALAVGYAVWQWHWEIGRMLERVKDKIKQIGRRK